MNILIYESLLYFLLDLTLLILLISFIKDIFKYINDKKEEIYFKNIRIEYLNYVIKKLKKSNSALKGWNKRYRNK